MLVRRTWRDMSEVLQLPGSLIDAAATAPAKKRGRKGSGKSSAVKSAVTGRFVSSETAPASSAADADEAVSFTVVGAPVRLDTGALASLVNVSLRHEATLVQLAGRVGMSVDELIGALERTMTDQGTTSFTEAEINVLAAAHVDLAGPAEGSAGAELAGRAAAHRLVADALTIDEAADALSVTAGRVRQRLSAGELVGMRRADGQTVIPRWQISDGRLVPGLNRLFGEAPELHPLVVARFMTAPHPDLELDEQAVSPRDWLLTGGDVEPVIELLHGLALRG